MAVTHSIASSLVAFVCGSLVSTAPIETFRWMNPCGGGNPPSSPNLSTDSPYEVNLIISDIIAMCEIAGQHAASLKMKILMGRLTMTEEEAQVILKDMHLERFPAIAGSEKETVGEIFLRDYERLSGAAVFLEQLAWDENDQQNGEYKENISRVQKAVYSTLCYLENGIYGQGIALESYVTRDVMKDEYRNITNKPTRFIRDYIISRDVESLEESVKTDYKNLQNVHE